MADSYARVTSRFWTGRTGRELRADPEAQVVAAYLITCQHRHPLGLYYLPLDTIEHETGRGRQGALRGLRLVCQSGFAQYDLATEYVWVPEMAGIQVAAVLTANDKKIKWIRTWAETARRRPFYRDFLERWGKAFHCGDITPQGPGLESPARPLVDPEDPQKPLIATSVYHPHPHPHPHSQPPHTQPHLVREGQPPESDRDGCAEPSAAGKESGRGEAPGSGQGRPETGLGAPIVPAAGDGEGRAGTGREEEAAGMPQFRSGRPPMAKTDADLLPFFEAFKAGAVQPGLVWGGRYHVSVELIRNHGKTAARIQLVAKFYKAALKDGIPSIHNFAREIDKWDSECTTRAPGAKRAEKTSADYEAEGLCPKHPGESTKDGPCEVCTGLEEFRRKRAAGEK